MGRGHYISYLFVPLAFYINSCFGSLWYLVGLMGWSATCGNENAPFFSSEESWTIYESMIQRIGDWVRIRIINLS